MQNAIGFAEIAPDLADYSQKFQKCRNDSFSNMNHSVASFIAQRIGIRGADRHREGAGGFRADPGLGQREPEVRAVPRDLRALDEVVVNAAASAHEEAVTRETTQIHM